MIAEAVSQQRIEDYAQEVENKLDEIEVIVTHLYLHWCLSTNQQKCKIIKIDENNIKFNQKHNELVDYCNLLVDNVTSCSEKLNKLHEIAQKYCTELG